MCGIRNAIGLGLALLAAAACGDDPAGPEESREYLAAELFAGPANALSAEVVVRAVGWDSVALRYWTDGESARTTPSRRFGSDSAAAVPLLGLLPESRYEVEVRLLGPGATPVDTLEFESGALPAWVPSAVPVGDDTTAGLLILSIPEGPVIVDNLGRVVWYREDSDPVLVNFQAHPSGEYTIFGSEDATRFYRVLDDLGREVRAVACVGYVTRFHEVRLLADSSALLLCDDTRPADLSPWGGSPAGSVTWTVIQLVRPDGSVDWEWHSADHFEIGDMPLDDLSGVTSLNLTHGNALEVDADGNLLVSFRELHEITKIDVGTGEVVWRWGGRRNGLTFLDDPKGSFERQHGLRLVEPGVVQFLDNSSTPPSRLVRYRIDETALTARLLWAYVDGPTVHTLVGGSTQVLEDGGGLVSFGRAGRVVEVGPEGGRRWELTGIEGAYVFRAERIPSLYAAERTTAP
jgi:hypothetical protein